jgi:hypothetical protein
MALALRDLQTAFAAHLLEGSVDRVTDSVVGDSITAAARLRIHRHQVFDSLATALASTFDTVQALVGEGFFRTMVRAYVARTLPAHPVLAEYGADFPIFIADHEPARGLIYLADIARLDWALSAAVQAPSGTALGVADLQAIPMEQLPEQRLTLAPGHALIQSPYPIGRIRAAAQSDAKAEVFDLENEPARLVVLRRGDGASFVAIGPGEASFLAALAGGQTLEMAAAAGFGIDPGFDLSAGFARFLALGLFAALHQ